MASETTKPAPRRHRSVHALEWIAAIVVPVVAGGIVGGPVGGVVTAAILIPWFNHLLVRTGPPRRRERAARLRAVTPPATEACDDAAAVRVERAGQDSAAA